MDLNSRKMKNHPPNPDHELKSKKIKKIGSIKKNAETILSVNKYLTYPHIRY